MSHHHPPQFVPRAILTLSCLALPALLAPERVFAEPARLVAYYPFEEGTGETTKDAVGHHGEARLAGDAAFVPGRYGLALGLTGFGDWVDTGTSLLDTTASHSVAAWLRLTEGFDTDFRTAVSQDGERVSGFYLQYTPPKRGCGPDRLSLVKWNRPQAEKLACANSAERPKPDEWIHVAGVVDTDGHRLRIYVNGAFVHDQPYDAAGGQFQFKAPGNTVIGRGQFNGKPVDFFLGQIDEVYFFQGVLGPDEIARLVNDSYLARKPRRGKVEPEQPCRFTIDTASPEGPISPLLFGHNLEHTRLAVWQGLSAQLLANRKFAGKPDAVGVAAHWSLIGRPTARAALVAENAYAGQSQTLLQTEADSPIGIAQDNVPLMGGRDYDLRVAVRCDRPTELVACVRYQGGQTAHESKPMRVEPDEWRELSCAFKIARTDPACRLEIGLRGPAGGWLGAVSLLPSDHFFGMRPDVIDKLRELTAPLLRWPGGNFTRDYRWQQGLLPVDRRPPILAGFSETLPFTDACDFHEIGTDEFIQLCRRLGAEPCITVNLNPEMASPTEAAAWVEYCNGGPQTRWGKVRVERNHAEPFKVKYWSIGNEIWGRWMGPAHCDAGTYARRVVEYAAAMRQADPSIVLIASGQPGAWDETLLRQASAHFDLLSEHNYAPAIPWCSGPAADQEFSRLARYPVTDLLPILRATRGRIGERSRGKAIGIALDEWNVWHNWFVAPFGNAWHVSATDAVYAAAAFNMFCREADALGLSMAAFFQPVQEGAIAIEPFSARLTPLGQVISLFKVHQGATRVPAEPFRPGCGVDICCSLSPDGRALHATLVNRNPAKEQLLELWVKGPAVAESASIRVLQARQLTPYATLEEYTESVVVQNGRLAFRLPRRAVALLEIAAGR